MRRSLLLAASLLALVLPGTALARGGDYAFDGVTNEQRAQVEAALDASAFDWNAVPARLPRSGRFRGLAHARIRACGSAFAGRKTGRLAAWSR